MHAVKPAALPVDLWVAIAIIFFCIVMSAFFAASETALTGASRARMHALERNGDKRAALVNRLLRRRERLIGTTLLGNTLVNIGSSAFMTSVLVVIIGEQGAVWATAIMTVLLLVFAEVLPKTVAINNADRVALLLVRILAPFVAIFGPVLMAVEVLVRGVLKVFGTQADDKKSILTGAEELKSAVDLLHKEGNVERNDRDMFGGLLDLEELSVLDIMVHRTSMTAINADLAPDELVREVVASPYSRLPLWRGEPDNIVAVLHAKDLVRALTASEGDVANLDIDKVAAEPWFIPATTTLKDQLQAFRRRKTHFALVVDEYGVVMGLVTLEDIIEEIVGDIKDEHDEAVQGVRPQTDGSVLVEGSVPIRDLNRVMAWDLPDDEATTIAGLVIHEARAIPESGQVFTFHRFRFEVLRKVRNRIASLRIVPGPIRDQAAERR
jgi:Mg2+/Co2+ transporter CorB